MDLPNPDKMFDILMERITILKALTSTCVRKVNSSPTSLTSTHPKTCLKLNGEWLQLIREDSKNLFTYFSSALYFTEGKSKKVKFLLTNFVTSNQEGISKIFKDLGMEEGDLEIYVSNIMNDHSDFEITLVFLCALYNLQAEIYFKRSEVTTEIPKDMEVYISPTGEEDMVKFTLSL